MRRFCCFAFVLGLAATVAQGQEAPPAELPSPFGPTPLATSFRHKADAKAVLQLDLGAMKSTAAPAKPSPGPGRIAVGREAEVLARDLPARSPQWVRSENGSVALIQVRSPGAAALRVAVIIDDFPGQVELRASPSDREKAQRLPNIARDGTPNWTPITSGDVQWIEVWTDAVGKALPAVQVVNVSHFFEDPSNPVAPGPAGSGSEKVLSCNANYACATDTIQQTSGRAVARIITTFPDGSGELCSGALINDRAGTATAWFATAYHCGVATAAEAAGIQFFWFYEISCSANTPSTQTSTTVGAQLMLNDAGTDFTLLKITGTIPSGLVRLGWSINELTANQPVFGIHHPAGYYKAISTGTFTENGSPVSFRASARGNETVQISPNTVTWSVGITEPGSSGSPLMSADGLFRGTLSAVAGNQSCSSPRPIAFYNRFSQAYPKARAFIDPPTSTADDWPNSASGASQQALSSTVQRGVIESAGDQDWFRFVLPQSGTWWVFTTDLNGVTTDTVGRIYGSDGSTVLAENDDDPAGVFGLGFDFLNHATAGTYYIRVTAVGNATGPYVLYSYFFPDDDHSDLFFLGDPLPVNGSASGSLSRNGDIDYFILEVASPGVLTITSSGGTDLVGQLYNGSFQMLETKDDISDTNRNFQIQRSVTPGRYYLGVVGYDVTTQGAYSITTSFSGTAAGNTNYTNLWWNPAESGWGINFNHQSNTIFASLFTYATDGLPMWLVASMPGQSDGSFTGPLYRVAGPPFNQVPWSSTTPTQVGTMTARFSGPGNGQLSYSVNGVNVTKAIERQVFGSSVPTCTFTTASRTGEGNYQDLWWNPNESGWGINFTHQSTTIFATLFTYDNARRDLWLVASMTRQSDGSFAGTLLRTTGPAFSASPWTGIGSSTAGTMNVRFSNGENGTLTYTLNGVTVVKSIQRQQFGTSFPVCR